MIHEDQKTFLKRLLRYARKNRTDTNKAYTIYLHGDGRTGPAMKLYGKVEAWDQMIAYMESLMRGLDEAIDKFDPPMEEDDDGT